MAAAFFLGFRLSTFSERNDSIAFNQIRALIATEEALVKSLMKLIVIIIFTWNGPLKSFQNDRNQISKMKKKKKMNEDFSCEERFVCKMCGTNFPRNSIINCYNNNDNEWSEPVCHFATYVNHKNVRRMLGHEFTMNERTNAHNSGHRDQSRIGTWRSAPNNNVRNEAHR